MFPLWTLLKQDDGDGGDNWRYETCKAPGKLSPSANEHPIFFTGQMPFLSPNQQPQRYNRWDCQIPWPCTACRNTSFLTWSTVSSAPLNRFTCYGAIEIIVVLLLLLQHIVTEHCTNYHSASNAPVVANANVFTNSTKYRTWPKFFTV